ncbi:MAG: hypothetical protein E7328_02975 [Clostridiales bacterium]|nr:hypothetical protein [Clostridiales bacterium]
MKRFYMIICLCFICVICISCGNGVPVSEARDFEGMRGQIGVYEERYAPWSGYLGFDSGDILVYFSPADYAYNNRENAIVINAQEEFTRLWEYESMRLRDEMGIAVPTDVKQAGGLLISISGYGYYIDKDAEQGCFATIEGFDIDDRLSIIQDSDFENADTAVIEIPSVERKISPDRNGGDSSSTPVTASIYRMWWDPFSYEGKWVLVQGRLELLGGKPDTQFIVEMVNPFYTNKSSWGITLFRMNRENQTRMEGTVIVGYGDEERTQPIVDETYVNAMCGAVLQVNFERMQYGDQELISSDYWCAGYIHRLDSREETK